MNRERAESHLRLLAEAEMRVQLAPDPPPWAGGPGSGRVKVHVVGQALTAARHSSARRWGSVLADFDLAVSVRRMQPGTADHRHARRVGGRLAAFSPGHPAPPPHPPGPPPAIQAQWARMK